MSRSVPAAGEGVHRYRRLVPGARRLLELVTAMVVVASIIRVFEIPVPGHRLLGATHFFYLIGALLLPMVVIVFPGPRRGAYPHRIAWWEWTLSALTALTLGFCFSYADRIYEDAWEYAAPGSGRILAVLGWLLLLEAGRRAGGWPVLTVTFCLSLYPMYAARLPDLLDGLSYDFLGTVAFHLYSAESFQGVPLRAFADWAIGYLLFGAVLQWTGGGRFFLDLTFALLGRHRGGPAKVSIFASGLMGSMSGSVVSNVLTTGALTVPAMRRSGFSAPYAAGVEACASTGGVLMPPVMGAAAFVMARYLHVSYSEVATAAVIPSLLYFYGLFMQIDAYAARQGIRGIEGTRLPRLARTLAGGWFYVAAFAVLVWLLLGLHWHQRAPYVAALVLMVLHATAGRRGAGMYSRKGLESLLAGAGVQLVELMGILAPIGVIIGALMMTGTVGNFTYDMVAIAGEDLPLLLVLGAATSFLLGIGMTVIAAYTFLAITLAPILIQVGVEPMGAHMFILYWGMLSYITPPVAIGAFAAAGLAGATPMRTALEAMRLGSVIYFIPFFFVLSPTLLLAGDGFEILSDVVTALAGITLIAGGLQGFLVGYGALGSTGPPLAGRTCMVTGGLAFAIPGGWLGLAAPSAFAIGAALAVAGLCACWLSRRARPQ